MHELGSIYSNTQAQNICGSKGAPGKRALPTQSPNYFIFMQSRGKNLQIIGKHTHFRSWCSPQENAGSTTAEYILMYWLECITVKQETWVNSLIKSVNFL